VDTPIIVISARTEEQTIVEALDRRNATLIRALNSSILKGLVI
jgi:DNA-binding response OmpR family regulator